MPITPRYLPAVVTSPTYGRLRPAQVPEDVRVGPQGSAPEHSYASDNYFTIGYVAWP